MTVRRFITAMRRLRSSCDGSVLTEFALLGPTVMALMLGVFQIGIGMQNYNAMRSVASDVMRYAVVNYQTNNDLGNQQLRDYARSLAVKNPYRLESARLAVTVSTVATPRVAGALEKTISFTYSVPTVLSIIGFGDFPISYSQPLFLTSD